MIVGLAFLMPAVCLTRPAHAQKDPEVTVGKSLQVLSEITRNPKTAMPRKVLRNAQGMAIIPDMFKMSFIFGARFGRGVLVIRQPDGTWSNPVFVQLLGGSFGAQAGAQSTDLVLVFQSQKGLDRFLKGKGKLTLGVDAAVAAGPAGKRFEASTDAGLQAEILSYSNTHGIFAGVSAEGGTLQIDGRANTLYYNQPASPGAILAINSTLAVPASTVSLQQLLAEKTAWPERVVKAGRPRKQPTVVDGETTFFDDQDGIEIDGAIRRDTLPDAASPQSRAPIRREVKPRADSSTDDDLDAIPPPSSRNKTPRQTKPQRPNDEDLPEAMPGPAPSRAKPERKPLPSKPEDDDDLPDLAPPRTS
jgi:SH3 domain-containing YSC84-like protein 1